MKNIVRRLLRRAEARRSCVAVPERERQADVLHAPRWELAPEGDLGCKYGCQG